MAQRKLQEVDASSIADVAFILLAFIIIITTLEKETGVPATLPQKRDNTLNPPVNVKERNILEILVNKSDQLMIEQQWDKRIGDIKPLVKDFFTNPRNDENLPSMDNVTKQICLEKIAYFEKLNETDKNKYDKDVSKWKGRLEAVKRVGNYKTVNKFATVAIQYDKGTSYGKYVEVRDNVMSGLNELRNELSLKAFNEPYSVLFNTKIETFDGDPGALEEHQAKLKALREVYPQKIIKLPARNVN